MPDELSAGAVLFRKSEDGFRFLLLHYNTKARHWDFPKGNIEEGESKEQTITREIAEETSISEVTLVSGFEKAVTYFYTRDGKRIHKEVTYFLVETDQEEVKISHEHIGYAWLSYEKALEKITFVNSKEVLKAALEFLSSR